VMNALKREATIAKHLPQALKVPSSACIPGSGAPSTTKSS
jgi:hypothetical protein